MAISLGQLHEVRQCIHIRFGVAVAVEELLPLAHHAHIAVVQVHNLDRQVILLAGRQLLNAHLDRRFAGHTNNRRARIDQLDAHRRREPEAHRAQPAGIDPPPRLVELVVLRRPHLMLADVGSDERVATGQLIELLDHELRLDQCAFLVVLQAILTLPFLDLTPPDLERGRIRPDVRRLDELEHLVEDLGDIADNRHVDLDPLRDRRGVDVDVDDAAIAAKETRRVADHAVVETCTHREQYVAVLHRHVRFVGPVHAEHAGELRIGAGKGPKAHERIGAREAEQADQPCQLRRSIVENDAAAGIHHRPLGLEQKLHRLPDLAGMPLGHRVVRTKRYRLRIGILG